MTGNAATLPGCPPERYFVTKPQLGTAMLAQALAEPALTWSWFVADSGYGHDPGLRAFCHQIGDGGQEEDQDPVFELAAGATLQNARHALRDGRAVRPAAARRARRAVAG